MSGTKKIHVSSSSLVDLKAELLRKKDQFRKEKLQSTTGVIKARTLPQKPNIWSQKNVGVLERAQKDLEVKAEEKNDLEKSRSALEVKARLYEQMSKGEAVSEEDGSKIFLVDFQKKSIDTILEKRNERLRQEEGEKKQKEEELRQREEEEEKRLLHEEILDPDDPDLEWVEYVDSLGRSRKCLKKDLPKIKDLDNSINKQSGQDPLTGDKELMSEDMRREMLREKWEREATEALDQDDVHYANVQHDEIRDHGVGFYQFGKQEENRQEQLDSLSSLRDQTRSQRQKKEEFKAKRAAKMADRLAKVKRRKLIREGRDPDSILDSELIALPDESSIEPPQEPELLTRDQDVNVDKTVREWDEGKKVIPEPMDYYEERRSERLSEFAPPTSLYGSQPKPSLNKPKSRKLSESQTASVSSEDTGSSITGPSPEDSTRQSSEGRTVLLESVITENLGAIRAGLVGSSVQGKTPDATPSFPDTSGKSSERLYSGLIRSAHSHSSSQQYPPPITTAQSYSTQGTSSQQYPPQGTSPHISGQGPECGVYDHHQEAQYQQYYQQYYQWWYQYGQYGPQAAPLMSAPHVMVPQSVLGGYSTPPPGFDPSKPPPGFDPSKPLPGFDHSKPPPNLPPPPVTEMDQSKSQIGPRLENLPNLNLPPPPPPPPETSSDSQIQNTLRKLAESSPVISHQSVPSHASLPVSNPQPQPIPPPLPSGSSLPPPPSAPLPQAVIRSQPVTYSQPVPEPKLDSTDILRGAPQPAHYASAPMKVQPALPRYQHINLHSLPPTLPAPPTAGVTTEYRSQTGAVGPRGQGKANKTITQDQAEKLWKKQFGVKAVESRVQRDSAVCATVSQDSTNSNKVTAAQPMDVNKLKPSTIPFASPYIHKQNSQGK